MKKLIVLLAVSMGLVHCTNNAQSKNGTIADESSLDLHEETIVSADESKEVDGNSAVMNIEESIYEFGVVKEGEKVQHTFTFTNTGQSPLIISNVSASCGCTTPEYSRRPVNPGEEGSITVVFDSENQVGRQQKIITVLSNASPSRTILQLKGEVK